MRYRPYSHINFLKIIERDHTYSSLYFSQAFFREAESKFWSSFGFSVMTIKTSIRIKAAPTQNMTLSVSPKSNHPNKF